MTYCVAASVTDGLVFASDSRTHAGVDQIATYSKMHRFGVEGERQLVLLSAGNLATTQAVLAHLRRDIEEGAGVSLLTTGGMGETADYLGGVSHSHQTKHAEGATAEFDPHVTWILGGQIGSDPPGLKLIYPQGNHIDTSEGTPYFQIGEAKFGKPVLDRVLSHDDSLADAAKCTLVSMEYTMRANVTVGPPIELLVYRAGTLVEGVHLSFAEGDAYLTSMGSSWTEGLRQTFRELPPVPLPLDSA
jgi:putative proteasome-type protease